MATFNRLDPFQRALMRAKQYASGGNVFNPQYAPTPTGPYGIYERQSANGPIYTSSQFQQQVQNAAQELANETGMSLATATSQVMAVVNNPSGTSGGNAQTNTNQANVGLNFASLNLDPTNWGAFKSPEPAPAPPANQTAPAPAPAPAPTPEDPVTESKLGEPMDATRTPDVTTTAPAPDEAAPAPGDIAHGVAPAPPAPAVAEPFHSPELNEMEKDLNQQAPPAPQPMMEIPLSKFTEQEQKQMFPNIPDFMRQNMMQDMGVRVPDMRAPPEFDFQAKQPDEAIESSPLTDPVSLYGPVQAPTANELADQFSAPQSDKSNLGGPQGSPSGSSQGSGLQGIGPNSANNPIDMRNPDLMNAPAPGTHYSDVVVENPVTHQFELHRNVTMTPNPDQQKDAKSKATAKAQQELEREQQQNPTNVFPAPQMAPSPTWNNLAPANKAPAPSKMGLSAPNDQAPSAGLGSGLGGVDSGLGAPTGPGLNGSQMPDTNNFQDISPPNNDLSPTFNPAPSLNDFLKGLTSPGFKGIQNDLQNDNSSGGNNSGPGNGTGTGPGTGPGGNNGPGSQGSPGNNGPGNDGTTGPGVGGPGPGNGSQGAPGKGGIGDQSDQGKAGTAASPNASDPQSPDKNSVADTPDPSPPSPQDQIDKMNEEDMQQAPPAPPEPDFIGMLGMNNTPEPAPPDPNAPAAPSVGMNTDLDPDPMAAVAAATAATATNDTMSAQNAAAQAAQAALDAATNQGMKSAAEDTNQDTATSPDPDTSNSTAGATAGATAGVGEGDTTGQGDNSGDASGGVGGAGAGAGAGGDTSGPSPDSGDNSPDAGVGDAGAAAGAAGAGDGSGDGDDYRGGFIHDEHPTKTWLDGWRQLKMNRALYRARNVSSHRRDSERSPDGGAVK